MPQVSAVQYIVYKTLNNLRAIELNDAIVIASFLLIFPLRAIEAFEILQFFSRKKRRFAKISGNNSPRVRDGQKVFSTWQYICQTSIELLYITLGTRFARLLVENITNGYNQQPAFSLSCITASHTTATPFCLGQLPIFLANPFFLILSTAKL